MEGYVKLKIYIYNFFSLLKHMGNLFSNRAMSDGIRNYFDAPIDQWDQWGRSGFYAKGAGTWWGLLFAKGARTLEGDAMLKGMGQTPTQQESIADLLWEYLMEDEIQKRFLTQIKEWFDPIHTLHLQRNIEEQLKLLAQLLLHTEISDEQVVRQCQVLRQHLRTGPPNTYEMTPLSCLLCARVFTHGHQKKTLLHLACQRTDATVAIHLIHLGADPNGMDDEGNPPPWQETSFFQEIQETVVHQCKHCLKIYKPRETSCCAKPTRNQLLRLVNNELLQKNIYLTPCLLCQKVPDAGTLGLEESNDPSLLSMWKRLDLPHSHQHFQRSVLPRFLCDLTHPSWSQPARKLPKDTAHRYTFDLNTFYQTCKQHTRWGCPHDLSSNMKWATNDEMEIIQNRQFLAFADPPPEDLNGMTQQSRDEDTLRQQRDAQNKRQIHAIEAAMKIREDRRLTVPWRGSNPQGV